MVVRNVSGSLLEEAQQLLASLGKDFSVFGATRQQELSPLAAKLGDSLKSIIGFHHEVQSEFPSESVLARARQKFGLPPEASLEDIRARVQDRLEIVVESVRESAPIKALHKRLPVTPVAEEIGSAAHVSPAVHVEEKLAGTSRSSKHRSASGSTMMSEMEEMALGREAGFTSRILQRHDHMLQGRSTLGRLAIGSTEIAVGSLLMNSGTEWLMQSVRGAKADTADMHGRLQIEPLSVPDRALKAVLGTGSLALGASSMILGARSLFSGH